MADVSLDDLIKKDKQKGKVDRLKQVSPPLFRNSRARNLSVVLSPMSLKTETIGGPETLCLKSIDLSRNVLMIIVTTDEMSEVREMFNRGGQKGQELLLRRGRRERRYSGL